jgi:hypothetical protein
MTDIELTVKTRPGKDATNWERAMALADDLARSKHIGEQQAKVYAALEVGIAREEVRERLDISKSNSYQTYYDAEDNVEHAEHIAAMLHDHPVLNPPQTVVDCSMDEFKPGRDSFDSDVRHDRDEDLTGEQFVDDNGNLVIVRQTLAEDSDGISGYLVNRIYLDTGEVKRRAIAAERLDELREDGQLCSASAEIT